MSEAHEHDDKPKKGHGHGGGHGPGAPHEEHHEGAPEWLISFADNVTLMMGFFVILLAMNLKPASTGTGEPQEAAAGQPSAELLDTAIAIREAFHNPVDPNSSNPIDLPLVRRLLERRGESQAERNAQIGREHDVRSIRPSDYYSLAGMVPFDEGESTLSALGAQEFTEIVDELRGHNLVIEVRGHVSAAESFGKPDRGMQLSYARALTVGRLLDEQGIGWRQLRLVACADTERLVPVAYNDQGHRSNQRVEIIVTTQVVKEHAPAEESSESVP
ncbi:MAG: OmpA family protein [Planctomycetes bacterium]|nr:OmpA family protein [Planctomycetota bacterium]